MPRILRVLVALIVAFGLATTGGSALAQPKGKDKEHSEGKGKKDDKPQKAKQHKHQNGKDLVGDKIKKNGTHKIHEHGKHTATVDVRDGKIVGVKVKHAEKGDVPVKKYKTAKKMADDPTNGIRPASLTAQAQYLGVAWIGYAYIDDWGDEVIYWFPYDMIYDGDTGAVEYIPIY